jgi:biopolymer transport protein ExbD
LLLAAGNGRGGGGIVVVADRRLTATRLVDILQVLRKSGATEISLVTIKGEGG